eukprot:3013175-Pleurochrysis_carterae.AAC.1
MDRKRSTGVTEQETSQREPTRPRGASAESREVGAGGRARRAKRVDGLGGVRGARQESRRSERRGGDAIRETQGKRLLPHAQSWTGGACSRRGHAR